MLGYAVLLERIQGKIGIRSESTTGYACQYWRGLQNPAGTDQEFDWGVLKRVLLLEVSQTVVDETRSEVLAAKKVVSTYGIHSKKVE
eukprot:913959-Rhodomonas_salina.6